MLYEAVPLREKPREEILELFKTLDFTRGDGRQELTDTFYFQELLDMAMEGRDLLVFRYSLTGYVK
jgi:hypothetical protein